MLNNIGGWLTDPAHWTGSNGIPQRILEHLLYSGISLLISALIAIPLGIVVGHSGRAKWTVSLANSLRAVPSLGLLFAVALWLGPKIASSLAYVIPSVIVLILLAVPPILSGTYAGIQGVDPAARDAAKGMGMRGGEVLRKVEIPCALPLMLSGFRSATLQVIATATIAASISLGGLGRYLIDGLSVSDYAEMASGAILVALLALLLDGLIALVQRFAVSPGLSGKFRNTPGNRPVVSTTARGDDATEPASPTDRADDQREALV
jgi:osmoprotectant transport system permease protein